MLPAVAGCGSDSSPPFTLTCSTHKLPSGFVRENVTITNTTGSVETAILYGQILDRLRRIYPPLLLHPNYVTVRISHSRSTYSGIAVRVAPDKPAYLILRLEPPLPARSILVTNKRTIHASDSSVLNNPDCHV